MHIDVRKKYVDVQLLLEDLSNSVDGSVFSIFLMLPEGCHLDTSFKYD